MSAADRPLVARSVALGEIIDGEVTSQALKEKVRALCIPVRFEGRTIAVVNREAAPRCDIPVSWSGPTWRCSTGSPA